MATFALVWFEDPVVGTDPFDGATVLSNRHRLAADSAIHRPDETVFLTRDGEVVGRWDTSMIARIQWVSDGSPPPDATGTPGVGTVEWRELISREFPRAYVRWSDEEDARLREEWHSGQSVSEISTAHERRPGAIASRLRHLGLVS